MKKALFLTTLTLILIILFFGRKHFFEDKISYDVPRQVRYSFTLKNTTNKVEQNILFQVYAPVKQTATQIVRNIDVSHPYELIVDQLGNQILCFTFKELAPYATEIIKIKTSLLLSSISNKIDSEIDTAEFLKPEQYVESDHVDIVAKANFFNTNNNLETARAIHEYVFNHINYSGYLKNEQGAYYAFKKKTGDCTEYMDLFTALCRAKNIPCKRIGGYVSDKNSVLKVSDYHNWVEFYDGKKWILTDPQKNKFIEDKNDYKANYIATRIISSSFKNIMEDYDKFRIIGDGVKVTMNL